MPREGGNTVLKVLLWIGVLGVVNLLSWLFGWSFWIY
jgi:hypothetical protein